MIDVLLFPFSSRSSVFLLIPASSETLAADNLRRSLANRMFSPKPCRMRRCLGSNDFSVLIVMHYQLTIFASYCSKNSTLMWFGKYVFPCPTDPIMDSRRHRRLVNDASSILNLEYHSSVRVEAGLSGVAHVQDHVEFVRATRNLRRN